MSNQSLREIAKNISCNNIRFLNKQYEDRNKEFLTKQFECKIEDRIDIRDVGYLPSEKITNKHCHNKRGIYDMTWWDKQYIKSVPKELNVETRRR